MTTSDTALLIIDVQNDFLPGGALAVYEGDLIIPEIQAIASEFETRIATQDWHPAGHKSFASSFGKQPFVQIQWKGQMETLWPDHCIQETYGAEIHPAILALGIEHVVGKGQQKEVDSYSAFFDNHRASKTELDGLLRRLGIKKLVVCGLATDYCVKFTVLDALQLGYEVEVLTKAVKAVADQEGALLEMERAGALLISR